MDESSVTGGKMSHPCPAGEPIREVFDLGPDRGIYVIRVGPWPGTDDSFTSLNNNH